VGGWYSDKEREDIRPEEALVEIRTRATSVIIFKQLRFNVYIIKIETLWKSFREKNLGKYGSADSR
jgi:hypothetical protein